MKHSHIFGVIAFQSQKIIGAAACFFRVFLVLGGPIMSDSGAEVFFWQYKMYLIGCKRLHVIICCGRKFIISQSQQVEFPVEPVGKPLSVTRDPVSPPDLPWHHAITPSLISPQPPSAASGHTVAHESPTISIAGGCPKSKAKWRLRSLPSAGRVAGANAGCPDL